MEQLTKKELDNINGGWRLFGWEAIYKNQTMGSVDGVSATGEYVKNWVAGICVSEGFWQTDTRVGVGDATVVVNTDTSSIPSTPVAIAD